MKRFLNKKIFIIFSVAALGSGVVGFFTYYIVKMQASNVSIATDGSEFPNGRSVTFSDFDKSYIIQRDGDKAYFLIDNFKAVFLKKVIEIQPSSTNFQLLYQFENDDNPKSVKVIYKNSKENNIFWGYRITF